MVRTTSTASPRARRQVLDPEAHVRCAAPVARTSTDQCAQRHKRAALLGDIAVLRGLGLGDDNLRVFPVESAGRDLERLLAVTWTVT